jgi:alanine racemase
VKTWVEISEHRLKANYNALAEAAGQGTAVLAVIKANAYGHGAALCASILARAGAEWLGVTDATEGAAIREALTKAAIQHPGIMVMSGPFPEEAAAIIHHGLTPVVSNQQQLEAIAAAAQGIRTPYPVHLEIDTGMARQGIARGIQLDGLLHWLTRQPNLRLEGVLTHFASSEAANSLQTAAQRTHFEEAIAAVASAGLEPRWIHAGNSSTIDNQSFGEDENIAWLRAIAATIGARPMVRPGIALYGYCLPIETNNQPTNNQPRTAQPKIQPRLKPVMTWKTRILSLRDIQPGDTVGYNATFTAKHPMRLALLPIGYGDGLRRELSASNSHPGGWVIIHKRRAPIVGRISMNLTVVDVTEIPVATGDEAILLGDGITADDHARLAHTISYEIVCGIRAIPHLVG